MKNSFRTSDLLIPALLVLLGSSPSARAVELAFENDSRLPIVDINVAFKGGNDLDPKGELGLAHFMGEMLLRGTKHHSKEELDLELDQMGARLDVDVRLESLVLRGAVATSQLDRFLKLLAEIIAEPSFPEKEIAKLKNEITADIMEEQGRDQTLAGRKFALFALRGHPYGKPTLGTIKDVRGLKREQIVSFYDQLVRDRHLLIVGTGDAREDKIRAWGYQVAESRPGGEDFKPLEAPENPSIRRLMIVDKPDRTQTQIVAGQVGLTMTDPDFFKVYLANHAFGGGSFLARMMVEIRVKRGWSYGAYSYFKHARLPRLWQMYLFPASKDTVEALHYTLQMAEDLKKNGITQDEFSFAKESLVNSAGFMYNTSRKRVENILTERTLDLPAGFMKSYADHLDKVSLSDANAAIRKFVSPERMSVLVLATAKDMKEKLAKAAGVPADQVQVVPYTQDDE